MFFVVASDTVKCELLNYVVGLTADPSCTDHTLLRSLLIISITAKLCYSIHRFFCHVLNRTLSDPVLLCSVSAKVVLK